MILHKGYIHGQTINSTIRVLLLPPQGHCLWFEGTPADLIDADGPDIKQPGAQTEWNLILGQVSIH